MATDARISTSLPCHPKTKKLARRLGPAGPLGCIYLFLWVACNRSDGDLAGMTDEDIELAVDWSGDEGAFVRAMVDVGFIEGGEGERSIHDWAEHNPWAAGASARSEKSRWAGLCKQHGRAEAARQMPEYAQRIGAASTTQADSKPESATGTTVAVPDSASGTPLAESGSAPFPSVSLPSPSLSDTSPSPSPPPTAGSGADAPAGRATRKCPKGFAVSDDLRNWAAEKVPGIDLETETEKFRDHTFANAMSDWDGTWRNWMRKAHERLRPPSGRPNGAHGGFKEIDYRKGVSDDGSFA